MEENPTSATITICLENLEFFAYHGLHEIEKKQGNRFEMNVELSFLPSADVINDINGTINYAVVYELIRKEMLHPRELLETFLGELASLLKEKYPQIFKINMALYKLTAPIPDFKGRVGVRFIKQY